MRFAIVFPGHGLPTPALTRAWRDHGGAEVLQATAEAAGVYPEDLAAADRHSPPDVAETAVLAVSICGYRLLAGRGAVPVVVAGHDAGELTAAVATGALTLRDGAALVAERARAIHDAATADPTPGGTLVVTGLGDRDEIRLTKAMPPDVTVAADDAPGQLVLAGPARQLAAAATQAVALGGAVTDPGEEGPVHTAAMTPVLVRMAAALARIRVTDPEIPLVTGTDAHRVTSAADLARSVAEGVLTTVRWRAVQERLRDLDLEAVVEVGPGTLRDLAAATLPDVDAIHLATPADHLAWLAHRGEC